MPQTKRHRVSGSAHIQEPLKNPAPAVRNRRQQAQPRSVTRGEAAEPRTTSCQTSGALRWAQQLTDTALIEISKAPASGAAGTRQRGYACKPFERVAKPMRQSLRAHGFVNRLDGQCKESQSTGKQRGKHLATGVCRVSFGSVHIFERHRKSRHRKAANGNALQRT